MEDRDFIDFKFGDHWASDFNLLAVSSGDRYSPPVYGSVNPNTAAIAGKVGVYKWKSQVNEKVFNISVAFDNINGQILNQIKEWLNPFKIDKLVFKEEPYKYYWVALNTEPKLDFLPFLEETKIVNGIAFKEGVYKGEFELQFVCFDNYGYSDWQSFDENYDYVTEEINGQECINFDNGSDSNLIINKIEGNSKQEIVKEVQGNIVSGEYISVDDVTLNDNGRIIIEGNSEQEVIEEVEGTTVTGEYININDVSLNSNGRIEISGNSRQETREGYNLWNNLVGSFPAWAVDLCGVKDYTSNSLTLYNKNTDKALMADLQPLGLGKKLKINTTYTFIYQSDAKGGNVVGKDTVNAFFHDINGSYKIFNIYPNVPTIISTGDTENWYLRFDINGYEKQHKFYNIMLVEGSYTANTLPKYEQYGAMPSLDYPSEIEAVGDNKNLFDENGEKTDKFINNAGVEETGLNSDNFIKQIIDSDIASNYIMSFKNNYDAYVRFSYFNNETFISREVSNEQRHVFTVPENCTKIDIRTNYKNVNSKHFEELKIEKGTVATTYSSYGCGSTNIKVYNKNLLKIDDCTLTKNGLTLNVKDGNIHISGTSTDHTTFFITDYTNLKEIRTKILNKTLTVTNDKPGKYEVNVGTADTLYYIQCKDNKSRTRLIQKLLTNICIYIGANSTVDINTKIQIEEGTESTNYIMHEEQDYTVDIQEEMLEGDYFDLINKKEVHNWQKIIFDGTENWLKSGNKYTTFYIDLAFKIPEDFKAVCNYFKYIKNVWEQDIIAFDFTNIYENHFNARFDLSSSSTITTVEEWKNKLVEMNNLGKPMILYFKLSKPRKLDLTEQQIQVLNKLRNSKIYQPTTNLFSTNSISPNLSLRYNYVLPSPSIEVPSEIESVGNNINLFDGELETGGIDYQNGTLESRTDRVRSKNFIKLDPDFQYTISRIDGNGKAFGIRAYDENKNYVGYIAATSSKTITFIPQTSNATDMPKPNTKFCYMKFIDLDNNLNAKYKIEKGTRSTAYSQYNQGSINVKIYNKNIFSTNVMNKSISGSNVKSIEIENGIKISYSGSTSATYLGYIYIIKDIRNYIGKAFAVSAKAKAFASNNTRMNLVLCDKNGDNRKILKSSDLSNIEMNVTIPEIKGDAHYLGVVFYANVTGTIAKDDYVDYTDIQVEEDKVTSYIPHKEQDYSIETQKPFRSIGDIKDCFVLKGDGKWYERHKFDKYTFKGTEKINYKSGNMIAIRCLKNMKKESYTSGYSNIAVIRKSWNELLNNYNSFALTDVQNDGIYDTFWYNDSSISSKTNEEILNMLKGNYVIFPLATPIDLECTEQQTQILNQLYNNKIYKPTTKLFSTDNISPNLSLKYNYVLPSPSFEVPSEIESVGDNKNLSKINKISTINGGYINASCGVLGTVEAGETYTISFNCSTKHTGTNVIYLRVPIGTSYENQTNLNYSSGNRLSKTFTAINSGELSLSASLGTDYTDVLYNIKLEKGTVATPWSPYEQGSAEIVVCNKNIAKNVKYNSSTIPYGYTVMCDYTLIKDKYYMITAVLPNTGLWAGNNAGEKYGFKRITTPIVHQCNGQRIGIIMKALKSATFKDVQIMTRSAYNNDSSIEFGLVSNFMIEEIDATTDDEALTCKATDYVDHQEQTFEIPLQKEFCKIGDYKDTFIKQSGQWYEMHKIKRFAFNGTEGWSTYRVGDMYAIGQIDSIGIANEPVQTEKANVICETLKVDTAQHFFVDTGVDERICITPYRQLMIKATRYATLDNLKADLAINNLIVYAKLATPELIPCTEEQSKILDEIENNLYSYEGVNHIFSTDEVSPLLSISYVPKQDIFIDYVVNQSNLLNDSAFYYDNNIYKKSYFDAETGDATKSGISEDRPVYLYNAGTTAANLNLTFDMIIPAENSPLIIQTESCKLTDNGTKIIKQVSSISISNFSRYKPFLEIYDNTLSNWQIEINSDLCEIYLKHKTDKTKIISLNKFNDNQSFLSLANCNFVDYSKPFPTLITAINNTAIENTIFNKLSVASSAQNYRLKNVKVEWKHTYL